MSFSSAPRGARPGKGTSAKKPKKQKGEFRTTKRRSPKEGAETTPAIDLAVAKARALEGLVHLGQQKFTPGPGGYDLTHWLRSLNLLLDDFEAKAKGRGLTPEYQERRKEVAERFSSGVDTSKIESEVESIRKEETEIRSSLERERDRIASRLAAIKVEKDGRARDVEGQRAVLAEIQEKRKSASFFSRLAGRAGPPTAPVELKIEELLKASSSLEEEALNLQSVRASLEREGGTASGLYEQQWLRIDAIGVRLKELEAEMQEKTQLAKERETATAVLADAISKIDPEQEKQRD
ncbi:MAG: hypothetical protein ABSF83_14945 [Nitrososphaerales archaeon]